MFLLCRNKIPRPQMTLRRNLEPIPEPIIVIAGWNGLASAQNWVGQVIRRIPCCRAKAVSWRNARLVEDWLASSSVPVILIGHSLGGGQAQLIAQRLPVGAISTLITVAPFAPPRLDTFLVRRKVGWWLNIVSARRWHDPVVNLAGRFFMGWRDQAIIPAASKNHVSRYPHQDFYMMMSERCAGVEHCQRRPGSSPP
jgi:pimeloyl-ACP methyl ester carboxylesterase